MTSVSIVMVLGACIKPVDVDSFLNDEKVKGIIESTKATVKVDNHQTGERLVGRDRRIEGLNPDKYYMVEKETDADGLPVPKYGNTGYSYPLYVTDNRIAQMPGGLYPDLGFITRIADGRINGLINFHTYTVRAAEAFPNGTSFAYLDSVAGTEQTATVTNGTITIPGSTGTIRLVALDVEYDGFEVMAVAVPPFSLPNTSPFYNYEKKTISATVTSFQLEGQNTEVDYVFANTDDPSDFKVLTVKIGSVGELTLNIVFNVDDATFSPNSGIFYQSAYYSGSISQLVTINVTDLNSGYTVVEWKYDGKSTSLGTGLSIILNNSSDVDYFALGKHTITLVCTDGDGNPYSADFTLEVKDKP